MIVCLLLLALTLSACQSSLPGPTMTPSVEPDKPTATPQPSPTPRPTATLTPTATLPPHLILDVSQVRGQEIDFWHPWSGDLAERVDEAVKEFNQSNEWGIKARARSFYGAMALQDAIDVAGEDGPEMLAASPEHLAALLGQEQLVDLNGYVGHAEWGMAESDANSFVAAFWQQDLSSGMRAGIPALRTAQVIFYNQTWANELGFKSAPTTPAKLQEQACAAVQANVDGPEKDKRGTGGWLIDTAPLTTLSWLEAFGAAPIPTQQGQPYTFQSKEAEAAITFLRKMFEKSCAWEGRNQQPYSYFTRRMALFYSGTLQDLAIQARSQESLNSGDRWTIIPFPSESGKPVVVSSGYSYGVLQATPEAQLAAWLFLRWMVQPRNQAMLGEVWPSLPVSSAAERELTDYQNHFPWFMILPLKEYVQPAPGLASWGQVRGLLQDAAWQVYRLPPEQMQYVLPQLDTMAREIENK